MCGKYRPGHGTRWLRKCGLVICFWGSLQAHRLTSQAGVNRIGIESHVQRAGVVLRLGRGGSGQGEESNRDTHGDLRKVVCVELGRWSAIEFVLALLKSLRGNRGETLAGWNKDYVAVLGYEYRDGMLYGVLRTSALELW